MPDMKVPAGAKQMIVEQVVLRCTCGDPTSHVPEPCPSALAVNLGVTAFWHKNPLRRIWHRLTYRSP
jgi:hypothetical protein